MTDAQPQSASELSAQPGSPLASLRERRLAVVASQWEDRAVPRWSDPEIYVRYKPIDHAVIEASAEKVRKAVKESSGSKASARKGNRAVATVDANLDVLIAGAIGVYAKINDGFYTLTDVDTWEPLTVDPETQLPAGDSDLIGFEPELGQTLADGEFNTARAIAKALYIEEGDILTTANWLSRFSGYVGADDSEFLGE